MERITFSVKMAGSHRRQSKPGLEQASRMEWAEEQQNFFAFAEKYFTEQKKERYSFDELW